MIGLFCHITLPWTLQYFIPALVIAVYKYPLNKALWTALLCGICVDILSPQDFVGIYSLAYMTAVLVLTRLKSLFFADNLSTLPVLTFVASSVTMSILLVFFQPKQPTLFFTDCIAMSLLEALFAFLVFSLPAYLLLQYRQKLNAY